MGAVLYLINSYHFQVFHGAESDIVWLQQDFNIFVVGLFDTYHASRALDYQKHGLANLLEAFCDFIPDKRYQLADWRIRYVENISSFPLQITGRIVPGVTPLGLMPMFLLGSIKSILVRASLSYYHYHFTSTFTRFVLKNVASVESIRTHVLCELRIMWFLCFFVSTCVINFTSPPT
jgi:hypothetical protein